MEEKKKKKSFFEILENILLSIKESIKQHKKIGFVIALLSAFIATLNLMGLFVIFPKIDLTKPDSIEFSQNENLKVLILPFHDSNDSSSEFKIEEVIENGLSEEKENYNLQIEIKIDSLSLTPKNFKDALKIGNEKKADFVIFGDLDSESKEYRINFVLTKKFYEFDIPVFIEDKHISDFKKNLKLSKIRSLESLKDEKFIIYNILGFSELKNGNCRKGIELLNQAITLTNKLQDLDFTYQDNSYYAYYMAECYLEKKEFENALPILEFSLNIDPKNFDSRIAKSAVHFILGDFNKTEKEIEFLKKTDFYDKSSLYLFSGFINLIKNKKESAFADFEEASLIDKNDSIPSIAEGLLNILKGDFNKAIVSTNEIEKYYELDKSMSNGISSFIYFFDGKINNTIKELKELEKNIKVSETDIDFNDLQEYMEMGFKLGAGDSFDKQQIDSTYNSISKKISKDANQNIEDALKMIVLMKNNKDYRMIFKHLKSAVKNNPDYATNYNFNNLKKDKVIDLKKEINNFKENLQFNDSDYILLAKISNTYDELGYGIISDYYKYKSISKNVLALLYLNNEKLNKEKLKENRELLKIHDSIFRIDTTKTNSINFYNRARAIHYLGFPERVLKDYEYLHENNPEGQNLLSDLALAEFDLKNYYKALEYDNKRILLDSLNPNNYWSRAAAYYYLEDYSNSLIDIKKGIELIKTFDSENENRLKEYSEFKKSIESKVKTTPNNGNRCTRI